MGGSQYLEGRVLCAHAGSLASLLCASGFGCSTGRMGAFLEKPLSKVDLGQRMALAIPPWGYANAATRELCGKMGLCAAKSSAGGVGERWRGLAFSGRASQTGLVIGRARPPSEEINSRFAGRARLLPSHGLENRLTRRFALPGFWDGIRAKLFLSRLRRSLVTARLTCWNL